MASMILGIAGAALGNYLLPGIGGTIGGAIFSAAGGFIDNMLFATHESQYSMQEGPRLGDLSVMASSYGQPIPVCYGSNNRVSGNVIWSTGLIEDQHWQTQTQSSGGGGKGGMGGSTQTQTVTTVTYTYRVTFAIAFAAGPCWGLKRIWANKKVIFDRTSGSVSGPSPSIQMSAGRGSGTHSVFDTINFYAGNGTQQVDPIMESHLGGGNCPAYRHTCYAVIENLQLADFGNVLPQIEVELQATETPQSVAAIAYDLCERAEVRNVSASNLGGLLCKGYIVGRDSNVISALAPLAMAFDFDAAEQRGNVRFVYRGGSIKCVLPTGDLGAVNAGNEPAEQPLEVQRLADVTLPREVAISFSDIDFDFQQSTQRETRTKGSSDSSLSQALPMTMTKDEARTVATRAMFEAWAARRTASYAVTDHWISLNPADVIGLVIAESVVPFKITRATRGADGVIEMEARFEDAEIYSSPTSGASANLPENVYTPPGPTRWQPMDTSILIDASDTTGFYWAGVGESRSWRGANIYRSVDAGGTYGLVSGLAARSCIGDVAVALPDGPTDFWDEGNTLEVVLVYEGHTLESLSETLIYAGGNAAWIGPADGQGGEIIQFRDADLIAANTYRLSGLLRGRRGTEHATATHGADEVFVMLNGATVGRSNFGAADWNFERLYKAVSVLTDIADATPQAFTNTGEGKRPFSPVHVVGARDDSNDLTVSWVRRTRLACPTLGGGPAPLGEAVEAYEVDVIVGGAVARTLSTSTPSVVYTAANQTTDGITPGDPVTLRVYQLSDVRGRGHPAFATV